MQYAYAPLIGPKQKLMNRDILFVVLFRDQNLSLLLLTSVQASVIASVVPRHHEILEVLVLHCQDVRRHDCMVILDDTDTYHYRE